MRPILIAMLLVSALAWLTENESTGEAQARAAAASRAQIQSRSGAGYDQGTALADRSRSGQPLTPRTGD